MERANLIKFLASSADKLIVDAESANADTAAALLREATELLALGSVLLTKGHTKNLNVITKEAA